jgi:AcrR family transcriptional regulator
MAKHRARAVYQAANLNQPVLIQSGQMPRPRAQLDHAAVTRAFAPDGLHGTTSETVARSAGVAKPTLYAHGGSKEAVFLACVEAEVERLLSDLSDADMDSRTLNSRARIVALAEAIIEHGQARPTAARLLYVTARHTGSTVAGDVDAALARVQSRLASILRRDTTARCAERVATALLAAAAALALDRGDGRVERDAALLGDAFAAALEPIDDPAETERVQSVGLY